MPVQASLAVKSRVMVRLVERSPPPESPEVPVIVVVVRAQVVQERVLPENESGEETVVPWRRPEAADDTRTFDSEVKKLVEEAVVEKKLVEVALLEVELPVIKRLPEMVEEALETSIPPVKVSKEVVAAPP